MHLSKSAVASLVALFLFGNSVPSPDPALDPEPGPPRLQGQWEIRKVLRGGVPDTAPVGMTVSFVGTDVHFQNQRTINGVTTVQYLKPTDPTLQIKVAELRVPS
jgi:hypothetical protein